MSDDRRKQIRALAFVASLDRAHANKNWDVDCGDAWMGDANKPNPRSVDASDPPGITPQEWSAHEPARVTEVRRIMGDTVGRPLRAELKKPERQRKPAPGKRVVCVEHPEWGAFASMQQAAKHIGVWRTAIVFAVRTKGTCRGLRWVEAA